MQRASKIRGAVRKNTWYAQGGVVAIIALTWMVHFSSFFDGVRFILFIPIMLALIAVFTFNIFVVVVGTTMQRVVAVVSAIIALVALVITGYSWLLIGWLTLA